MLGWCLARSLVVWIALVASARTLLLHMLFASASGGGSMTVAWVHRSSSHISSVITSANAEASPCSLRESWGASAVADAVGSVCGCGGAALVSVGGWVCSPVLLSVSNCVGGVGLVCPSAAAALAVAFWMTSR